MLEILLLCATDGNGRRAANGDKNNSNKNRAQRYKTKHRERRRETGNGGRLWVRVVLSLLAKIGVQSRQSERERS